MGAVRMAVLLLAILQSLLVCTQAEGALHGMNPIRKVVNMLQDMQKKVTEEGKRDEELFESFMCYCKNGEKNLQASIDTATARIESLTTELKGAAERKKQTEASLKEHQTSNAEAKATMATATSLREKEAAEFAKSHSELETNIAAIDKAVAALEKGAGGAFLQTRSANIIRKLAVDRVDLSDSSRQELLSFLAGTQSDAYAPQSGEITGILKQIGDEMRADLKDAKDTEDAAIQNFEALVTAKKKEVSALQVQIEDELARIGRLGVGNAEMINDLEDTKEALEADHKFVEELKKGCGSKEAEYEEIKKTRAEELLALSETVKVLNDDDALELFKSTLPSPAASFVQVQTTSSSRKKRALEIVRAGASKSKRPGMDLIFLALQGKKAGFDKVIKLVDDMVVTLEKEQADDDGKKEYCNTQLDQTEDKKKQLELAVSDSEKAVEELNGMLVTVAEEIKGLADGIKELDQSVVEATKLRKQENEEHKALMAADSTAKDVLNWAKNRLAKFYTPALYKPPPARELSDADQINVNLGGEAPVTPPPGGIGGTGIGAATALVQVRAHRSRGAPPPPPEAFGAYTKKGEHNTGVVEMINLLIKDLDKEMTVSKTAEVEAQKDYESLMADSAEKRAADSKSMAEKESAKATGEEELQTQKDKKTANSKDLLATVEYLAGVHSECDWLLKYFDVRKDARASEIESLHNAKAVLNGADYSLLQVNRAVGFLARHS